MKKIIINNYKKKKEFKNIKKEELVLPKYYSPLLNFINGKLSSSQTSPSKVGQLTEIFEEYKNSITQSAKISIENWAKYYDKQIIEVGNKDSRVKKSGKEIIDDTIQKNIELKNLVKKIVDDPKIDQYIELWVKDLMYNKTFNGLSVEKIVAIYGLETIIGKDFDETKLRDATPKEESKKIDLVYDEKIYIQIKPKSFKGQLVTIDKEGLDGLLILYYDIKKGNLEIEIDDKRK